MSEVVGKDEDRLLSLLREEIVPPPVEGSQGHCPWCKSWRPSDRDCCANCYELAEQLDEIVRVEVMSLYRKPSLLRNWLTYYKPNPQEYHPEYGGVLLEALRRFLSRAPQDAGLARALASDLFVVVPSSRRAPPHPLESLLTGPLKSPPLDPRKNVLERGEGVLDHRQPSVDAFRARESLVGKTVTLLDDVYTSGAAAQSAAAALRTAGATVSRILVLGRRINPEYSPEAELLWLNQSAHRPAPWL